MIGRIGNFVTGRVEAATGAAQEFFFEPVIRLGVTGLARSGKTVFITSLVANLLERGRMGALPAVGEGRIEAAWLQPQPDNTVPRFPVEQHLATMTGAAPGWPESTRAVSELRLSLRLRPQGVLGAFRGSRVVHLDIIDYPGEWLLDLALLDKSYALWSEETLARAATRTEASAFQVLLTGTDGAARLDEPQATSLADHFATYLQAARRAGYHDCTPGRFLLPGDLKGAPVLTFAPLPPVENAPRGSLYREFERRFNAYKQEVVKPFFRDHFARIDRQIVLVDLLGALDDGPERVQDLQTALNEVLGAFRPGRSAWLARLLGARRVERILLAATKADHLHHSQHDRLSAITDAMLSQARGQAQFQGAETAAMAIAALRCTTEETRRHEGRDLDLVRGRLADGRSVAVHAGQLPEQPQAILAAGPEGFTSGGYVQHPFQPAPLTMKPGQGPPHIRLDRAAAFLFGDML